MPSTDIYWYDQGIAFMGTVSAVSEDGTQSYPVGEDDEYDYLWMQLSMIHNALTSFPYHTIRCVGFNGIVKHSIEYGILAPEFSGSALDMYSEVYDMRDRVRFL